MNKDIFIRDVDEQAWNRFTGICKIKGQRVGAALSDLIKKVKIND